MRYLAGRLTHFYKNISIKHKLLLLFYIQIIIPLLFIGYTSYQKSAEIIEYKSINYSQDILKMIQLRFNDLSTNMRSLTLELLYDNRIYEALNTDGVRDNVSIFNQTTEIKGILRQATLSRNEIQSICIVTKNKEYYGFDSDNAAAMIEVMLPYDRIIAQARKGSGRLIWSLDRSDGKIRNIYITRMIYDRDTYEEVGLLAILIKKEYLESIYKDLSSETINNISILSQQNEDILNQNTDTGNLLQGFLKRQIESDNGYYIDKQNDTLVSYILLEDPQWKIIYHIPLKKLYREINTLRYWVLLMILYALIILSVLSVLTAVDIVNPIKRLVEGMKNLEKGAVHKDIKLDRDDELGYLSDSFNRMSQKIDYLVNCIYKEELALKEAEIKALQAQINPHFLYNTLENINWMAQLNGVPEISETVSALASLIDAGIGRGDRLISLKEELHYIDNYMTILKSRYEDRLQVVKQVEEDLLGMKIPRLLIQPLIENAVKHGIEKSRRVGIISLNACRKEADVVIEITDNGIGMTEEDLKSINDKLSEAGFDYEKGQLSGSKSVGMENVNRRIKLLYGDSYGISIESSYGDYTRVIVRLPGQFINEGDINHVQGIVG